MSPPLPRNGRQFCGLLVGGSNIPVEFGPSMLHEYGVKVEHFWQSLRQIQNASNQLPKGTDAVLIMTDISGSDMIRAAVAVAKSAHVPYALIGRKKAAWTNGMRISGFVQRPSWWTLQGPKEERIMSESKATNGVSASKPADIIMGVQPDLIGAKAEAMAMARAIAAIAEIPTMSKVDTTQRYVDVPGSWTASDYDSLRKYLENWKPDYTATQFITDFWVETGKYRTLGSMIVHAGPIASFLRIGHPCVQALVGARRLEKKRADQFLAGEYTTLGDYVSQRVARELLGITGDVRGCTARIDRTTALRVYRREDVIARKLQRGKQPTRRMSVADIENRILNGAPIAMSYLRPLHNHEAAITNLINAGKVVRCSTRGGEFLCLPGQEPPVRRPPGAGFPKPRTIAAVDARAREAAPSQRTDTALRAEIFAALRSGQITAKDAAEMLRGLAP